MNLSNEHHFAYLKQIVTSELPPGFVITHCRQESNPENYWCRIAFGRIRETVAFPDVWVEDRREREIRQAIQTAIRRLRRRMSPTNYELR